MEIKVISYGNCGNTKTAEVVIIRNGHSETRHLWYIGQWVDKEGLVYDLTQKS